MKWPDDFINKVICGDCLEIMKYIPDGAVDLVVTDPPYPNMKGGLSVTFDSGVANRSNTNTVVGDNWAATLDWARLAHLKCSIGSLVFCSFHSVCQVPEAIGQSGAALITWHKPNAMPPIVNAPHYTTEFIWVFRKSGIWRRLETHYVENNLTSGCVSTGERVKNGDGSTAHPTQKPLNLMRKLIAAVDGDIILDPFAGSGTTLVAAKQLGRKYIGIEINPDYCRIAEDRLRQEELF